MKTKYKQCTLEKTVQEGLIQTVSWIPSKFAKIGQRLKLENDKGIWTEGWVVKLVGDEEIDQLPDYRKGIRNHRKQTGDSTPKKS